MPEQLCVCPCVELPEPALQVGVADTVRHAASAEIVHLRDDVHRLCKVAHGMSPFGSLGAAADGSLAVSAYTAAPGEIWLDVRRLPTRAATAAVPSMRMFRSGELRSSALRNSHTLCRVPFLRIH